MADTTEGDSTALYLGLLLPALMALIPGLVIHSFIIGVNVNDWWKGRSVTPVDHVVTSLGISRMCIQCADTLHFFLGTFSVQYLSSISLLILDTVYSFFTYANIWLTSLLSIVLYLKISNLHTRLFLYLRRMILHKTLHFIAASIIVSSFNSLIPLAYFKVTNSGTCNTTMDNISTNCIFAHAIYSYTTGSFFPLLLYSISSVLLFISLYHHTTRMKMSSNLSISLETYYTAMRLVSITFIYNTIYFISHFVNAFYDYFYCVDYEWLYIHLDFLPALHSSYLIYRTAKLRDQMSKVLHNVVHFFFHGKDTDTREDIEMAAQ